MSRASYRDQRWRWLAVYDGMDVVQERDATNTTKVNYSRSGNIGGLLARSDSNGHYFFCLKLKKTSLKQNELGFLLDW